MSAASAWRPGRLAGLVAGVVLLAAPDAPARNRDTFSIDYGVTILADDSGVARIRWDLAGAEEVKWLRLQAPPHRFFGFSGSGRVQTQGDTVIWRPGGPYGHLEYQVRIAHARGQQGHFDSFAGPDWIVARARDLFPRTALEAVGTAGARPHSRARLSFRLPAGWASAAAHPLVADHVYALRDSGKILDRPRGWIALGKLARAHQDVDGVMVQIAQAPGSQLPVEEVLSWLGDAVPRLRKILGSAPEELLIVTAGDPMWRGGLSAFHSLFLHGDRPLRTPDKTSPILHEVFHVMQPFRIAPDANWIGEGLAEYYSLELQVRGGTLPATGFRKGLQYFARFGLWDVDLTKQADNAATNNSAPLVMYAIDQRIQQATAGRKRLDDAVTALANGSSAVTTRKFRQAVEEVSGKSFSRFFRRHVTRGVQPPWQRGQ